MTQKTWQIQRTVPDISWTGREAVTLFVAALAALIAWLAIIWLTSIEFQIISKFWGIIAIAFGSGLAVLLALLFACRYQNVSAAKLGFKKLPRRAWQLIWQIPIIIFCAALFAVIVKYFLFPAEDINSSVRQSASMDSGMTLHIKLLMFTGAAVLMPIAEEVIFRGVFFQYFSKHTGIIWSAIISAFLFAAVHFNVNIFPAAFIAGLGSAWLFYNYQSLWASILLHMVNNSLVALMIATNLE